jgi:hypothetical protein
MFFDFFVKCFLEKMGALDDLKIRWQNPKKYPQKLLIIFGGLGPTF